MLGAYAAEHYATHPACFNCSVANVLTYCLQLLSEWDIDSDLTPAAIAERRHPLSTVKGKVPLVMPSQLKNAEAKKQMLMYGHVELPTENFS